MLKRFFARIGLAMLAASLAVNPVAAQHRGGGHAGAAHIGGGRVAVSPHATYVRPSNHYYGGRAYNHPGYAYRSGYGYHAGYGYRYPHYRNNGLWIGAYAYPYGYGYGYNWPYSYDYGYPSYGYTYPDYGTYSAPATITPDTSISAYPSAEPAPVPATIGTARLMVQLPADAQLWIDGQLTAQTGSVRSFETPATLEPGRTYSYRLRATWVQDGKPVTREREVTFLAGNQIIVNMTAP